MVLNVFFNKKSPKTVCHLSKMAVVGEDLISVCRVVVHERYAVVV